MAAGQLERFLAHAIELESEAMERYEELALVMAVHNNRTVGDFFSSMVCEGKRHCQVVTELAAGLSLPDIKAWEFEWPGTQSPGAVDHEAVHYRMGEREAVQLALDRELAARDFYESWAQRSEDETTRKLARQFSAEEADHARQLRELMATLEVESQHRREDDDPPHEPE